MIKQWLHRTEERLYIFLSYHLPKEFVKWCFIRVAIHATLLEPEKVLDSISILKALEVWERKEG